MHNSPVNVRLGVAFHQVEKRYGSLLALRKVTVTFAPGEFTVLLGANGAGKTTLLKMAALLIRPTAGRVTFPGAENSSPLEVKRFIGMVAHNILLYDELSAEENLSFFARFYGLEHPEQRVRDSLEACSLARRARDLVRTFSRGMRQRLAIARALIHRPGLLLLDEPTTFLDLKHQLSMYRILAQLGRGGMLVVSVTHDLNLALQFADRVIVLEDGRVAGDGTPRDVLDPELIHRVFGVRADVSAGWIHYEI